MKQFNIKRVLALAVMLAAFGTLVGCTAVTPAATQVPAQTATETAAQSVATDTAAPSTATEAIATTAPETVALKVFDATELAKFDGQNGNAAYVAVDGKVYDVSGVSQWSNGTHAGGTVQAGKDQTEALGRSPHGAKNLEGLPIVGIYQ